MAPRESSCGSFFTFTITVGADALVAVDIAVAADHVEILDALTAPAEAQ